MNWTIKGDDRTYAQVIAFGSTFVPGWYCLLRRHRVDFPNLGDLHNIVKQQIPHDTPEHSRIDR